MKSLKLNKKNRRGVAFILAMIFMALLASLSVGIATMSSANAQLALNHKEGNRAMNNAMSGVQIVRYVLEGMSEPNSFSLESGMRSQLIWKGLTGVTASYTEDTISLASMPVDSESGSFSSTITLLQNSWQADITGISGEISRTIRVNFNLIERGNPAFDFGIATKGPLLMTGQTEITGFNVAVESDVLIDTSTGDNSFEIGNQGLIEGSVHIVDPLASYDVGTKSEIGGDTGSDAEDNVILGVEPVEFPVPDTEYFRQFATGDTIDSTTNLSDYSVLNNVIIAANTNPTFASNTVINGVLFVEQPNKVTFAGKVDIYGIIVGNGDIGEYSSDSTFDFSGQIECHDVSSLEGEEFNSIKSETGSFLIAPSSVVDFSGQSNVINGVIACSGVRFTGQAGGVINGSIVNYSSEPMVMQGQGSLCFNRSGTTQNPAGFTPVKTLTYNPDSYQELRN